MATELIGIAGQSAQLQLSAFDKRLLSRFRAETVFNRFGLQRSIPRRGGKSILFRRLEAIYSAGLAGSNAAGSAPSALTEGTPGAAIQATWTTVQGTVSQYGQYLFISDLAEEQSIDDVVPEFVDNFGEAMKDALDLLTRDILVAGTNRQYASIATTRGGASGVGSGMYLNLAELREAKRTLRRNNAKPVRSESGKYVVITHVDSIFDLEADTNITNPWKDSGPRNPDSNQLFDIEFKDLPMGFRVFSTTNARIFASLGLSGADVYQTHVLGEEAYGVIKYDALPAKIITKDRGTSGVNDPLDQVASIGWKASHTAVILSQANHVVIEHASRAKDAA